MNLRDREMAYKVPARTITQTHTGIDKQAMNTTLTYILLSWYCELVSEQQHYNSNWAKFDWKVSPLYVLVKCTDAQYTVQTICNWTVTHFLFLRLCAQAYSIWNKIMNTTSVVCEHPPIFTPLNSPNVVQTARSNLYNIYWKFTQSWFRTNSHHVKEVFSVAAFC